jgi:ATP-dependent helicase/DNAse subunit B
LERYQDCPFRFFASDVLKLEEAPEDESMLSPRARGRFIHEVFERFFEAWDCAWCRSDHAPLARSGLVR